MVNWLVGQESVYGRVTARNRTEHISVNVIIITVPNQF